MSSSSSLYTEIFGVVCVVLALIKTAQCYKPVIIIHGILDSPDELVGLKKNIEEAHPGTNVTIVDLYNDAESFTRMWTQVSDYSQKMGAMMNASKDGVHLICYSQGGLICRGVLSVLPYHNVDTFIALSSPLMGQFGDTSYLRFFFPHFTKHHIYEFFYSTYGQHFSIANYWNDPHHRNLFQKYSDYLALLNGESAKKNIRATQWKRNFLKINHLVLIGGPDDGVISPWQSSQFGMFDKNETVVEMRRQKVYAHDVFGLRTLDKRKAITTYTVPGVEHVLWHKNQTVFDNCIKKWLR
ncbi:PREDICTED: lysosomal thioesterase PPT2-A-like [Priapulus caudatus]|uniref:palmitoyl-CoA hydrolase n=1 Tax=Priapulus caudatus TaxID=37621 RepID=A0ABM1E959_PRICU|nr:PREDICTED: lysosomal thioesterase PPT2-A-like [Priapulus caudatus]